MFSNHITPHSIIIGLIICFFRFLISCFLYIINQFLSLIESIFSHQHSPLYFYTTPYITCDQNSLVTSFFNSCPSKLIFSVVSLPLLSLMIFVFLMFVFITYMYSS